MARHGRTTAAASAGTTAASLVAVALVLLQGSQPSAMATAARPGLWVWLSGNIPEALSQLQAHKGLVTDVSYGAYACNSTGGLVSSFNATLDKELAALGVRRHALIGCGKTPMLRTLFSNPTPFINAAVAEIEARAFDGYNLDFEPYDGMPTNADGLAYAAFVDTFADALHAAAPRKALSLDFFTNVPIWNLAALNSTSIDTLISMDTYVQGNATFEAYSQVAHAYIAPAKLGLGMCTTPSQSGTPYGPDPCGSASWTPTMLSERFDYLTAQLASPATGFSQINLGHATARRVVVSAGHMAPGRRGDGLCSVSCVHLEGPAPSLGLC